MKVLEPRVHDHNTRTLFKEHAKTLRSNNKFGERNWYLMLPKILNKKTLKIRPI